MLYDCGRHNIVLHRLSKLLTRWVGLTSVLMQHPLGDCPVWQEVRQINQNICQDGRSNTRKYWLQQCHKLMMSVKKKRFSKDPLLLLFNFILHPFTGSSLKNRIYYFIAEEVIFSYNLGQNKIYWITFRPGINQNGKKQHQLKSRVLEHRRFPGTKNIYCRK